MRRLKANAILVFILTGLFIFVLQGICAPQAKEVHVIRINDDTINPVTASYIIDSIDEAYKSGAECLIVELDTPGGLLTSTRLIVKGIMSARVPVIVFIYPSGSRAGSAGVFITYASHIAAMAPSTNIGAAHPVQIGQREKTVWDGIRELLESLSQKEKEDVVAGKKESQEEVLAGKVLHDTVAFVKALAKERGRNVEWAEVSVRESASITEEEALKNSVIEIIARDERDLLEQLDGRTVKVDGEKRQLRTKDAVLRYFQMDFRQRFLNVLANPNIAYMLLVLGFYGLLFEVTHAGVGFPGIAGTICLILAFFSMQILPTNYAGLALIILGVILFIAEIKVPGFGLLTLGGLVCMTLGSLFLFESPYQIMRVSLTLVISLTLATAAVTLILVGAVVRAHRRKVICGREGLIGEIGKAKGPIGKGKTGKVLIHGEIWDSVSDEDIKGGDRVEVCKIEGMVLTVKTTKGGKKCQSVL